MLENIIFRCTKEEKEVIKQKAKEKGFTVSQYIRYVLIYGGK